MWGQSGNETVWGKQWIADHLASQNRVGKPVILGGFGVTSSQSTIYATWWNEIVSSGLTGDLIWQVLLFKRQVVTDNIFFFFHPGNLVLIFQGTSFF